jgi:6-phosphogluconate dehydrogenase
MKPCRAEVLTAALYARFRSRKGSHLCGKILSAMRAGFGGHETAEKRLMRA